MKQVKAFFIKIWPELQKQILEQLKGAAVKAALKAFLKTGAGVGFKAWLVKFVTTEFMEEVAEPIVKAFFTRIGYTFHRDVEGNILIKRLQEAREDNNANDYNNTVDDILS
jgi:hypothetical protein